MTTILAILSQKGGAGKTTIAVNLAIAAYQAGLQAIIIDIDPQASATAWADLRGGEDPTAIAIPSTRLHKAIETAQEAGADLIIVDSAPSAESATLTAAKAADLVLVPCRASILDLNAITTTIDLCDAARATSKAIVNSVKSRSLQIEARSALADVLGAERVAPVTLWDRTDYVRSLIEGKGVLEYAANGKAADEIKALFNWVRSQMKAPVAV